MSNATSTNAARNIALFVYDGVQILDVAGPSQAFSTANEEAGRTEYDIRLFAIGTQSCRTASGFSLVADPQGPVDPIDTLIIPGGPGIHRLRADPDAIETLRAVAERAGRLCAICTGAFGLAEMGLLNGKRAVTHWRSCDQLAGEYPLVDVDPNPLFVQQGNVWTSAGVTAGIDLTLALIEADLGHALAVRVARRLVVYMRRSGGQRQYSEPLELQSRALGTYDKLLSVVAAKPTEDWSVSRLAERVHQTARTFHRNFLAETGVTPSKSVERIRSDLARTLLETTELNLSQIAHHTGFHSEPAMRRALKRYYGASPHDLRGRFK